jgi:hypothetical protein
VNALNPVSQPSTFPTRRFSAKTRFTQTFSTMATLRYPSLLVLPHHFLRVRVRPQTNDAQIWAFITAKDNATQHVTTFVPRTGFGSPVRVAFIRRVVPPKTRRQAIIPTLFGPRSFALPPV